MAVERTVRAQYQLSVARWGVEKNFFEDFPTEKLVKSEGVGSTLGTERKR